MPFLYLGYLYTFFTFPPSTLRKPGTARAARVYEFVQAAPRADERSVTVRSRVGAAVDLQNDFEQTESRTPTRRAAASTAPMQATSSQRGCSTATPEPLALPKSESASTWYANSSPLYRCERLIRSNVVRALGWKLYSQLATFGRTSRFQSSKRRSAKRAACAPLPLTMVWLSSHHAFEQKNQRSRDEYLLARAGSRGAGVCGQATLRHRRSQRTTRSAPNRHRTCRGSAAPRSGCPSAPPARTRRGR